MEPKFDYAALHTEAERRIRAAGALDDSGVAKLMVDFAIELTRRSTDEVIIEPQTVFAIDGWWAFNPHTGKEITGQPQLFTVTRRVVGTEIPPDALYPRPGLGLGYGYPRKAEAVPMSLVRFDFVRMT